MKKIKFWTHKFYRRAIQEIASRFYINPNPSLKKSIFLAGTARSGTTWLGDLIAANLSCRILFEPFNPNLVPEYRGFHYFQYLQPDVEHPEFYAFAKRVLSGEIRNRWVDRQNERIVSQFRLIKEIRANLALKWIHHNFPEVPMIFMIRHPCAVVASRMALNWATDQDITPFLAQPDLIHNHLAPYMDVIRSAQTVETKHAVIWCISNLVPLKQFKTGEIRIVFYENLITQPERTLPAIFESIGYPYSRRVLDKINRPSQTTRVSSAVVTQTDKLVHWKKIFSKMQIDSILQTVEAFDLSHLYGDSVVPVNPYAL